jgi:hypothetical protein
MTGRRAIVGLCLLCALLVSAFAAQGASAATTGTTGTAPAGTGYNGNITGSGGETLLHSVISGIEVELKSTELAGSGTMESMLAGTGEHTSNGTGTIEYKGVTVVKPAGKGCAVKTGQVTTEKLKATTAGQGMGLKFEPNGATPFAKFEVEGCGPTEALKALNGVYEVTGSVIGEPTEGTNETVFTRLGTTNQGTLKLRGQKAGINGVLSLKTAGGGEAIKASTVTTP